jgi:ribosomal protein S18 acetylase RimI-like enzyme
MPDSVTIRWLQESDAESMAHLRRHAYETDPFAFAGAPDSDPTLEPELLRRRLAAHARGGDSLVVGALADELVGMVGLVREEPAKFRHKARLWGFYVEPGFRGRGIGHRLLTEAARAARRMNGVEQLTLRVSVFSQDAIHLYGQFGFRIFGREPRALKAESQYVDELHMITFLGTVAV